MVILSRMDTIPPFDHIGGHPLIDFVNTKMTPGGQLVDQLTSNEDVVAWMVDVGMIEMNAVQFSVSDEPNLLDEVRAFRQKMRDMLADIVAEQPVSEETIAVINTQLEHWQGTPQLVKTDDVYERPFSYTLTEPLQLVALLADTAAKFITDVDFRYVKQCDKSTCIRYFLDTSRNHSRRWCSMEGCGNRNKAKKHYARKKKKG
jgi:predicted RNA-binding Zn ribbon-like protein